MMDRNSLIAIIVGVLAALAFFGMLMAEGALSREQTTERMKVCIEAGTSYVDGDCLLP